MYVPDRDKASIVMPPCQVYTRGLHRTARPERQKRRYLHWQLQVSVRNFITNENESLAVAGSSKIEYTNLQIVHKARMYSFLMANEETAGESSRARQTF